METVAYAEKSYASLMDALENGSEVANAGQLVDDLRLIDQVLLDLEAVLRERKSLDQAEEVTFFKVWKPKIYSEKIYRLAIYNLIAAKPLGDADTVANYWKDELRSIRHYLSQYAFFYQYYKRGATELDEIYFTRHRSSTTVMVPEITDSSAEFSTLADYSFAKFMALERMTAYILRQLASPSALINTEAAEEDAVRWTGDTINLAEMAYGLWLTGQLNNGNISISKVFRSLEQAFQVKMGRAHRRWIEIAQRKIMSTTKYFDVCKSAILHRLDEENSK